MTPRRSAAGFTLIELVVALALVGMISVILFESLRFSQRSYQKVIRRGEQSWQMFATQRLLRSLLESAHLTQSASGGEPSFLGEGGHVSFTAPAPLAEGGAGLYRYDVSMRPDAKGSNDLIIRWRNDFANEETVLAHGTPAEEILIEAVQSVSWSYRGRVTDEPVGAGWADAWTTEGELPASIRLRVTFAASDARAWPDLVIATRVTADAHCEFDTIAQRCRNAS